MLKPLKAKITKSKELTVKVDSPKPAQIVLSIVDGREVFSNADTGEIVQMSQNRFTAAYEVFNNEKASVLISSMAQGFPLIEALTHSAISKSTFSMWLMNNEEFAIEFEKARTLRAQHAHEDFYENTIEELTGELPTENKDLILHTQRLNIIEKRQKILSLQKKEDNPARFSDKDMNQTMAASVAISIDPDIIEKMQKTFRTSLNKSGDLDLEEANSQLDSILDAEFKEVANE